jgi:hypothetical protein
MDHYKTNFILAQHHKYSLTELDDLLPFERDIYLQLLVAHLEQMKAEQSRGK